MSIFGMFAPRSGHVALYNDLCKLHDVDRKTRVALDLMVQQLALSEPGVIFIDSSHFKRAIEMDSLSEHEQILRELCYKWHGKRV